jgi:hypothetical protein
LSTDPIVKLIKLKEKQMNLSLAPAAIEIFLAQEVYLNHALARTAYLLLRLLLQLDAVKFPLRDVAETAGTVLEEIRRAKHVMSGLSQDDIQVIHLNVLVGIVMRGP